MQSKIDDSIIIKAFETEFNCNNVMASFAVGDADKFCRLGSIYSYNGGISVTESELHAFESILYSGLTLNEVEQQYIHIRGEDHPNVTADQWLFKGKRRHRSFHGYVFCLLGRQQTFHSAREYLVDNKLEYRNRYDSFYGESSAKYKEALNSPVGECLANFLRNKDGQLFSIYQIEETIWREDDCHALLKSAIANSDSEALNHLITSRLFSHFINRSLVVSTIKAEIDRFGSNLIGTAFDGLIGKQSNGSLYSNMLRLISQESTPKSRYVEEFWPGAQPATFDKLVGDIIKDWDARSSGNINFLEAMKSCGVDLFPGVIMYTEGYGGYQDLVLQPYQLLERNNILMNFVGDRATGKKRLGMGVLLLDVPIETILDHPKADILIKEIFWSNRDASILKNLKDKSFIENEFESGLGL